MTVVFSVTHDRHNVDLLAQVLADVADHKVAGHPV